MEEVEEEEMKVEEDCGEKESMLDEQESMLEPTESRLLRVFSFSLLNMHFAFTFAMMLLLWVPVLEMFFWF